MFTMAFASIINIGRELIKSSHNIDESYDVYPGDFSKMGNKKLQEDLYNRRIQLWMESETDEPKDEVQDNGIYTQSDAVKTIMAFLKGKKVKKAINWELKKQDFYDCATKRIQARKQETEEQHNKIIKLEEERSQLIRERDELKVLLLQATNNRYYSSVKHDIEELLHKRQTHHLRKLILQN